MTDRSENSWPPPRNPNIPEVKTLTVPVYDRQYPRTPLWARITMSVILLAGCATIVYGIVRFLEWVL